MQYRAIGLVQGVYQPSEEQLNRGNILADDGAVIDAVLLGRVTSLIKKHIDLESSHLWVVYPRTRQFQEETEEATPEGSSGALHLQIVGVWEPETLGLPGENPHTSDEEKEAGDTPASSTEMETGVQPPAKTEVTAERPADNYFSIRGEIINYDEEKESILVKIVQGAKRSGKPPKAFKLNVLGKISGKTVGYFWELDVQRQGELRDLFLSTAAEELIGRLQQHPLGKAFWNGPFAGFLREFGTRGRQEFELTIPRWNDEPQYLLNIIRLYLRNEFNLHDKMREADALRAEETERLLKTLPAKARLQLRFVISSYAKMADLRERVRPTFIAEAWFYRRIVLEVMRRLSEQGVVRMSDLPFIDFNELRAYVAGHKTAAEAFSHELIEKNRREHLINLRAEEPPMSIIGGYKPTRSKAAAELAGDADALTGVAASPGTVVARARVITDLQRQAEELQKGEILVVKYTDASWTPLFVLAAGVVADIGSALSHSSIVSREFGIPAVVNTRLATQKIRTGDFLYLNGDAGIVRIEERAERQAAA